MLKPEIGCSQIMSVAEEGWGVCKLLTIADKVGRGVRQMLNMAGKRERGVRQILTLADKGGRGFWLLMVSLIK